MGRDLCGFQCQMNLPQFSFSQAGGRAGSENVEVIDVLVQLIF